MNKKTLHISAILSLFSLLSLFIACEMTAPEPEQVPAHEGKAAVLVIIETDAGRTVSPNALQDADAWALWGGKQGDKETLLKEFSSAQGFTVYLNDTGTWNFTLSGYKDNELILSGTIGEQTISPTETNTLTFAVKPVLEGDGAINLVIELPPDIGITEARVFKNGEEAGSITPADDKVVLNGDYPAGAYRFVIKLYNDDSQLCGVISEAVHVWAHLTSAKTYTLSLEDLNLTYPITYHLWEGETETSSYHRNAALTLTESSRDGFIFTGWYADTDFSGAAIGAIPAGSMGHKEFYAKWTDPDPDKLDNVSAQTLAWISANAEEGGAYTITLNADKTIAPATLSYGGKKVNITLKGGDTEHTITLSSSGALFAVGSNVTLTLGDNISLRGLSSNTASLVRVNDGGTLAMETGSKISGNTSYYGGGVYVATGATFTMDGGAISGNTATGNSNSNGGGGVYVDGGMFTMSGGNISGNTSYSCGGGVYVSSGTFTMSGGAISGNTASFNSYGGGGVYVNIGTFTMSGGAISGNTSTGNGGGVYVGSNAAFIKQSGGIIYGSDAESGLKNTTRNGGHAVYVNRGSSSGRQRNTTAGEGVTLYSRTSGSAGGWE
jgi:uncharacterized repeat protein (TIGR02543 family)